MGGSAGVNMLLGMVRTKFAAVLIGTTGVGLMAGFTAIQGIIGSVAGMGIQASAVREVAVAVGKGDDQAIGRAVLTLRRVCWLTGLVGMLAMMAFSPLLSQLTFDSDAYTLDIAALGVIILFGNLAGGQLALLQGMRRIGDMARANIVGAVFATLSAVGFYYWLGLRGIVPSLVSIAAFQLVLSWYFAKRIPVPPVQLGWRQTFVEASSMVKLGLVLMWTGLMGSAVSYITVTFITQQINVQAVGIYSAAFALSGMFVNFVLGAMGADYYPRLTALASDKAAMNRLVNEQTEIGLLLALPGLIATLVLAPWVIRIFYTNEFLPAVELLQWFILGCLGRVISWPFGYVIMALGKGKWFLFTETGFHAIHVALITLGVYMFGLEGVAIGFFVMYLGYIFAVYLVCRYLIGFVWSVPLKKIFLFTLPIMGLAFIACRTLALVPATFVGCVIIIVITLLSIRGLVHRIGPKHPLFSTIAKLPGIKSLLLPQ